MLRVSAPDLKCSYKDPLGPTKCQFGDTGDYEGPEEPLNDRIKNNIQRNGNCNPLFLLQQNKNSNYLTV